MDSRYVSTDSDIILWLMTLEAGRKLGPYEIVSLVGAGGMGEVYRARDTRLARTVAIKVLPSRIASTATLRARFEREARAIAALSHTNICAIYDVGSDEGTEYLVMEYLEGDTLAERLARGPMPVNLILRYGVQIAEALTQAHRAGITHRDLKPGNIMITAGGIKLLDFGLAQTINAQQSASDQSDLPTQAAPLTAAGSVLGTLQYMSPEQLEGKSVDHRTDIFALGVILYEMITGRRPFAGGSQSVIIAGILSAEPPPIRSLQPTTPPAIERIVVTALEKNPDDRWQTAHDVARQLRWMTDSSGSGEQASAPRARRGVSRLLPLLLLPLAGALVTWAVLRFFTHASRDQGSVVRLEFAPPPGIVAINNFDMNPVAISPDGRTVCFLGSAGGDRALYLRDLTSYQVRRIEGSEAALAPFWSPDSQWIGFSARGKLWKTKWSGDTPPEALCEVATSGAMGTWSGHTILFSEAAGARPGIFSIPDSGGAAVPLTQPVNGEWKHSWPYYLPDGQHFVYQALMTRSMDRELVVASLDGTRIGVLLKNVSFVRSSANDQLMYVRDGKLLAQRINVAKATLVGEAVTVADDVTYFYPTGRAYFDAVPSGLVLYRTDTRIDRLSMLDRSGAEKRVIDDGGRFYDLILSPDASKAAVTVLDRGTGLGDIWEYDLARGVRDRFTSGAGMKFSPLWSLDGRWILYSIANGGTVPHIVRRAVDGSTSEDVTAPGRFREAKSFSPDGDALYFVESSRKTKGDIYRLSMTTRKEEAVVASEFDEEDPGVSPDGKWLAYSSDATGSYELYLQSMSDGSEGRIRVSSQGGLKPRWRRDSKELFYLSASHTVSVARSASGRWNDVKAEPLFTTRADISGFDVLPDGQAFLVIQTTPGPRDNILHLILGWH